MHNQIFESLFLGRYGMYALHLVANLNKQMLYLLSKSIIQYHNNETNSGANKLTLIKLLNA